MANLTNSDNQSVTDITWIDKSGVRIMLSGGFKTIPAEELPQYKFLFDRIEEPVKKEALATPKAQPKPDWEPKNIDDVTEACLKVWVTKKS